MLGAAVFGALAPEHAGIVGAQRDPIHASRNEVDLAREVRHPKAVHDVRARNPDLDGLIDRNADLVGGRGDAAALRIEIMDLPPPAAADPPDGNAPLRPPTPPPPP